MHLPGGFAARLAIASVLLFLILGGTAILTVVSLDRSTAQQAVEARSYLAHTVAAERLRAAEETEASAGRAYLLTRNLNFLTQLDAAEADFDRVLNDLRDADTTSFGQEFLRDVLRATADYRGVQHQVLNERTANADAADVGQHFEREVVPLRRHLREMIDQYVTQKESGLKKGYAEMRAQASRAVATSAIVVTLALLVSIILAWSAGRYLVMRYHRETEAVLRAERAVAARNELLGIVAHDLRSPLNAISMRAQFLLKGNVDERTRQQAASIGRVAARMEHLITNLLDAASIEAGCFSVKRAPCEVEDAIREALEMLEGQASLKGVRLEYHVGQPALSVSADRERLIQVLANLIGNAVKFAFDGGRVDTTAERTGREVRFSVSDAGPGISPEHLHHVFDRFWKGESGGRRGTGLGLHIAKSIVDAHGGRIWAESQLGQGATFHFTLPLEETGRHELVHHADGAAQPIDP